MLRIFSPDSPYKKQARFVAILWTLLILIGCFTPSKDIPQVNVPLIDKWVHLVLFGGFTFLWLCSSPRYSAKSLIVLLLITVAFGASIELMQGLLTFLGRSMELLDAVADTIGGLMGMGLFCLFALLQNKQKQ
jgi:VanZ family protein